MKENRTNKPLSFKRILFYMDLLLFFIAGGVLINSLNTDQEQSILILNIVAMSCVMLASLIRVVLYIKGKS
ncbi:hypothetical protein ABE099_10945 [Paenibacillus turicensis]|uniref:hypothetical protein n=1 Tax=Paenibacillus turicensis TaxID=160487 RepID=UPI003D29C532